MGRVGCGTQARVQAQPVTAIEAEVLQLVEFVQPARVSRRQRGQAAHEPAGPLLLASGRRALRLAAILADVLRLLT